MPRPAKRRPAGSPDFAGYTLAQLDALIASAQEARQTLVTEARQNLRQEMSAKADALGISVDELMGNQKARRGRPPGAKSAAAAGPRGPSPLKGKKAPVRFRGPNGETWTGRGRTPRWLSALEAKGKSREKFAV